MTGFPVTQLRIDFLEFTLSEPNPTGFCVNDYLAVTGGSSLVPQICGTNTNEHGKNFVCASICPQECLIHVAFLTGCDTV